MILQPSNADELNTIIVVTHDIGSSLRIADTLWLCGRDHESCGRPLPDASSRYRYDLIERGFAWHGEIECMPEFFAHSTEIKQCFATL